MPMPFEGELFKLKNPDGSEIEVRGWGNQFYAVFETLDGFTIVKEPETGYFQYARLSEDKNHLVPTGSIVGKVDSDSLGLKPHIRVKPQAAKQQALGAQSAPGAPRRWEVRRAEKKRLMSGQMGATDLATAPPSRTTVGNYVGLCLLIDFPDVAGTIPQTDVNDFCNLQGYSGFGNNGSVRDYFYEISDGKLTYTNLVTAYYTAAHNRSYYTNPSISFGTRARQLIVEALDDLVAQGFDFSQLTSDSGGYIYALNVFYVGPRVNNWSEGLWPHSWSLASAYNLGGGKKFFDYQITNMGSQLALRTFCHENGHMICEFPDLYDYGGESRGVGNFCLMCSGGNSKNPVHVCAYLKNEAGWATSLKQITTGTATINAGQNDFYIYKKNNTEYFIVENRQQQGRDQHVPDAGLAIWHIDESGSNNNEQMTSSSHYECSLEQADNNFDMEHNTNSGDSGDLFASPNAVRFADDTGPDAKWWNGSASSLEISQISTSGTAMTFLMGKAAQTVDQRVYQLLLLD
ncbi:MAG: M6 family metalloprotease domain-containing protein [Planctomycetes bacterium]|nr:M6 family metalloprotease domain-containing protein [Planctomycetota bacterium]